MYFCFFENKRENLRERESRGVRRERLEKKMCELLERTASLLALPLPPERTSCSFLLKLSPQKKVPFLLRHRSTCDLKRGQKRGATNGKRVGKYPQNCERIQQLFPNHSWSRSGLRIVNSFFSFFLSFFLSFLPSISIGFSFFSLSDFYFSFPLSFSCLFFSWNIIPFFPFLSPPFDTSVDLS